MEVLSCPVTFHPKLLFWPRLSQPAPWADCVQGF